jgi:cell division protein ZapA
VPPAEPAPTPAAAPADDGAVDPKATQLIHKLDQALAGDGHLL